MKAKAVEALAEFHKGLNCAQTVLYAFCEQYGLCREFACKLANGLGGGVRSGEICGAVTGAALVVGLKHGQKNIEDLETKKDCNAKTAEFIKLFRSQNGSIICRDILGCDISTKEGMQTANDKNLFYTVCAEKVRNAIILLEDLGY